MLHVSTSQSSLVLWPCPAANDSRIRPLRPTVTGRVLAEQLSTGTTRPLNHRATWRRLCNQTSTDHQLWSTRAPASLAPIDPSHLTDSISHVRVGNPVDVGICVTGKCIKLLEHRLHRYLGYARIQSIHDNDPVPSTVNPPHRH